MKTEISRPTNSNELKEAVVRAGNLIKQGNLVAFPTETVYGLGADAMNKKAVERIFIAKNRPADNPLIVHISKREQLLQVARTLPEVAEKLMDRFWPGPLSLVLPKNMAVPAVTTAGLDTVVVRFPSHPIAQAIINSANTPIAAPSANLSGKVSPTSADHVIEDLINRIPFIIDGGDLEYGLESTVVDCTVEPPTILRPGSITLEQIKEIVPSIVYESEHKTPRSPGMKYRHYSPSAPVILFCGDKSKTTQRMKEKLDRISDSKTIIIWHSGDFSRLPFNYQIPATSIEAAPRIYYALRAADSHKPDRIFIQSYEDTGVGHSIMNRLRKAASKIVIC